MAADLTIFQNSDMSLEVTNLRDRATKALVTGATVTARVLDTAGDAVSGVPDPITLAEVAGSKGFYRGNIPDVAVTTIGQELTIVISVDAGANLAREWTLEAVVRGVE